MSRLPNLFQSSQKTAAAQRLYDALLSRLHFAGFNVRVLSACREIRRYATAAKGKRAGVFIYFWEMEAHAAHKDYDAMWRSMRAREQAWLGGRVNLITHEWTRSEGHQLIRYAPVLYFRGRYRLGCRLMETALEMASHRKGWVFEWLWHIYKPVTVPSNIYEVTLSHFYSALNRDFSEWQLWDKFLDDLNPKLFRMSGQSRESIRENPRRLKPLFEWVVSERRKRLFTGTADGERDLVEPASRVRKRQSARKRVLLGFDVNSGKDRFDQNLLQLFPELANLPKQVSFKELLRS